MGWSSFETMAKGTASRCGFGAPDLANAHSGVTFTSQAVTPLTDRDGPLLLLLGPSSAPRRRSPPRCPNGVAAQAFAEDKTMIEAQQRVIDETAEPKVMPIAHDRGLKLFNRLVDKLASEEAKIRSAA